MASSQTIQRIVDAAETCRIGDDKKNLVAFTLGFAANLPPASPPSMGTARLTYWNGRGNAELVRLMLEVCGEEYEERVYKSTAKNLSDPSEMHRMFKDGVLAFDQVPLLEIDGLRLVQKFAIVRYLARKHCMYGSNATEAVLCDMVCEGLVDYISSKNHAKYLPRLDRILKSTPGDYLVSPKLQFVDIVFFYVVTTYEYNLDEFPALKSYVQKLFANRRLEAYLQSSRRYPSPGAEGYYDRVFFTLPWLLWNGDKPTKLQGLVKHWPKEKLESTKCANPVIESDVWRYEASRETIDFVDPHFHVWDVSDAGIWDSKILFPVDDQPIFDIHGYENMMKSKIKGLRHAGGVFIDAMSVCYPGKSGQSFQTKCLEEAKWVSNTIKTSKLAYKMMPSAALEEDGVLDVLKELKSINPNIIGIRQILNFEPCWPRNKPEFLGNLLENDKWVAGLKALDSLGMHFDAQLNSHQYAKAIEIFNSLPNLKVFINHLGTPKLADLEAGDDSPYWRGMQAFAARKNTFIKISMLCYISPDWDKNELVWTTVHRIIKLFGVDRCMIASNYPVDYNDKWPADRLFPALLRLLSPYTLAEQKKLFGENTRRLYQ